MADLIGLYNFALQGAERGKQRGLAALAGKAYNAPREQRGEFIGKMAATDPGAAYDAQKHLSGLDDDARAQLGQSAAIFDVLPEEQKPQAYGQLAQQAHALGIPVPMEYRPEFAPNIQKLAQVLGGGGAGNSVQSRFVDQQGNVMALMRDGTVQNLGVQAENRLQMRDQPGVPQQRGPGEVPYSIDPSLPPEVQAAIRANEGQFASAPDGANIQIPNSAGQMGGQLQAAPPKVSPVQLAQLGLQEQAAQRDQQRLEMAQQAANQPKSTMSAAEQKDLLARKAKVPQLQNAIRGMSRIESALKALDGAMVNTGPVDAQIQRFTPKGQELEAAVGAIQNSILSLTRVPGTGSQSDLEARIASMQYPSLDKPPEVNRRTLDNLKLFMRDLAQAYESAVQVPQDAPRTNRVNSQPAQQFGGFRILED